MKFTTLFLLYALIGSTSVRSASAQTTPASNAQEADDAKARKAFFEGDAHYAAGRYEKAVELFEEAYDLSKRATLLVSIANAHERLGNYEEAAASLRKYLASPVVEDASSIQERLNRIETNAEQKRERAKAEAERQREAEEMAKNSSKGTLANDFSQQDEVAGPNYMAWGATGVGIALIGTGIVTGALANSAGSSAEENCSDAGFCSAAAMNDIDRQKTFALISDITMATGIISTGVGVLLLLRKNGQESPDEQGLSYDVGPSRGGFHVGVSGRF